MWKNRKVRLDNDYPPEILAKRKEYTVVKSPERVKHPLQDFVSCPSAGVSGGWNEDLRRGGGGDSGPVKLVKVYPQPATLREKIQRWSSWQPVRRRQDPSGRGAAGMERLQ